MDYFGRCGQEPDYFCPLKIFMLIFKKITRNTRIIFSLLISVFICIASEHYFSGNLHAIQNETDKFVVIIDPGHGGEDSGAVSSDSVREKDVSLEIALLMKNYILQQAKEDNIKVILTRDHDAVVGVDERAVCANQNDGDLFISIHANWSFSRETSGFQVFCYDANLSGKKKNPMLWNEVQGNFTPLSKNAADLFLGKLEEVLNNDETKVFSMKNNGVTQYHLLPLRSVNMPAVMIEIGFLSHTMDEAFLKDNEFKNKIAQCFGDAVLLYKEQGVKK